MNRNEAKYFLEGLAAGLSAPHPALVKILFLRVVEEFELSETEMDTARVEIDRYLNEAEAQEEKNHEL